MTYSTAATRKEIEFTPNLANGSKGVAVRKLQEWLNLNQMGTAIDGDFGPATQAALKKFQKSQGLNISGVLTLQTWNALIKPMVDVLNTTIQNPISIEAACLKVAKTHLAVHPLEIGGPNRGPWVRLYTGGNEGPSWLWCAGFVSVVVAQASHLSSLLAPIKSSLSCDTLAAAAKANGKFVTGRSVLDSASAASLLGACAIFLIRRSPGDWEHMGFAFNFNGSTFETLEGNTNDDGNSDGYEVCTRIRKLSSEKDFIKLG